MLLEEFQAFWLAIKAMKHSAEFHARPALFVIKMNMVSQGIRTPLMLIQATRPSLALWTENQSS